MGCGSSQQPVEPTISPYELEILKKDTRYTEDEIKLWFGAFMDENPSGDMDKNGFITLYATLYPNGTVDDFSEHLFVAYDKDSSGLIDFKEFMHVMNIANKGTSDEKLGWAFSLYDTDGSGEITREEVIQVTTAIYKMQGVTMEGDADHASVQECVDQIFKALEKDNDGKLSQQEFIIGSKSNPKVRQVLESI